MDARDMEMNERAGQSPPTIAPEPNRTVYVAVNWRGGGNDRVRKLLRLRDHYGKVVLVTPGTSRHSDEHELCVPPLPNPTGLLRVLGLGQLKRSVDRALFFPSTVVLFIAAVLGRLSDAIARDLASGKQVTLITVAPPHGMGLLGLIVKRRFPQIRWLIDWQDLWTYDENYYLMLPRFYRPLARALERRLLAEADLNLTTNAVAGNVLRDVYGVDPSRIRPIHHHFDPSDLEQYRLPAAEVARWRADSTARLGFFGTLLKPPRVPGGDLIVCVDRLRRQGIDVELHVHGDLPNDFQTRAQDYKARGAVFHGRTTHEQALALLERYDYLVILLADLANARAVMSIKLPHYLQLGLPIVAIVPRPSAIADMVDATRSGVVIPVGSDWCRGLEDLLRRRGPYAELPKEDPDAIEAFRWERISADWAHAISDSKRA